MASRGWRLEELKMAWKEDSGIIKFCPRRNGWMPFSAQNTGEAETQKL